MGKDDPGWIGSAVKELARVPAYLLIFVLALAPAITGSDPVVTIVTLVIAAVVVGVVELGRRRQIPAMDAGQAKRLGGLNLPAREAAVQTVLEGIVDPEAELDFMYASAPVDGYTRQDGKKTVYPFDDRDKQVTPILDAQGVAYVQSLLNLAGKRAEKVRIITTREWRDEFWLNNLILLGSPNASNQMEPAAEITGCPYSFNADVTAVLDPEGHRWPESPERLVEEDFAILAKGKRRIPDGSELTYLIIAGIGPSGTLGACYYLWSNIIALADRFGSAPFATVLRIDRRLGFTSVKEVTPSRELAVAPG
jgi:hypothetical protein